ncbi:hypothetical protein FB45DRAFT_1054305 [Roridomyces roridus]|uniref:MYND-type domain-containing protein n=1 Tax=Roridomyces roridus TaxID=1738132 RepID=A0AAD7C8G3_9AGAR|nr:hypothetical protein FB45DRAFT_1054305 [Roridomyces roridus]
MHESLQISALRNQPIPIQRIALKAAGGSIDDLNHLLEATSPDRKTLLLPSIYQILDSKHLPNNDSDRPLPAAASRARSAVVRAMDLLPQISPIDDTVGIDLWPRLWAWFLFLESECQSQEDGEAESLMCARIIRCAFHVVLPAGSSIETKSHLRSTPGFYSAVARAWRFVFRGFEGVNWQTPIRRNAENLVLLTIVLAFVSDRKNDIASSAFLEALVDGVDGSTAVLAGVMIKHIDVATDALSSPEVMVADSGFLQLEYLTAFLCFLEAADKEVASGESLPHQIFRELTKGRVAISLFRAVHALSAFKNDAIATDNLPQVINQCLHILSRLFLDGKMYAATRVEVAPLFLLTIASCGQQPHLFETRTHAFLKQILCELLPCSTLYSKVLRQMEHIAADMATPEFAASGLLPLWTSFIGLVDNRLRVLNALESGDISSMRACDNMLCGKLGLRADFERCGGCLSFYYCSKQCQSVDWEDGGHKSTCKEFVPLLSEKAALTTRERSFVRAVLHYDYALSRFQIYTEIVQCLRAHPGGG